jgi:hypothetical protein
MKDSNRMPGGFAWFEQNEAAEAQRFEVVLLTIDSVK